MILPKQISALLMANNVYHLLFLPFPFPFLQFNYYYRRDVRFMVEGELISAHRYVLVARNKWFRALLGHQWKETTTTDSNSNPTLHNSNESNANSDNNITDTSPSIPIQDISAELFRLLLEFIYLDELEIEKIEADKLPELLICADRFSLIRLKVHTISQIYSIYLVANLSIYLSTISLCLYHSLLFHVHRFIYLNKTNRTNASNFSYRESMQITLPVSINSPKRSLTANYWKTRVLHSSSTTKYLWMSLRRT